MFNIIDLDTHELLTNPETGEPIILETGAEANHICKILVGRYRPRKAGDDLNWKEREQTRFDNGEYVLPDYLKVLKEASFSIRFHYLHLAKDKPGLLAYTKDEAKGRADIQTRISLEGYIELYGNEIGLSEEDIKDMLAAHEAATIGNDGLKLATIPDEIERVYTNYDDEYSDVSGSCMRYETEDFEGNPPMHPTRIYGAGDLAIAYFENDDHKTTHRALCWPQKKIYSRVYGGERLHNALKKRGFKKSAYYDYSYPSFEGAKLLRVPVAKKVYVMPYIDEPILSVDAGDHLIMTKNGNIKNDNQCGLSVDACLIECACCGEETSEDEAYNVYAGRYDSARYCECCFRDYTFECAMRSEYYDSRTVKSYEMQGGEVWSEYAFEDYGAMCPKLNERFLQSSGQSVIVDEEGTTEWWSPDAIEDEETTWQDAYTEEDFTPLLVSIDVKPVEVFIDEAHCEKWAPHFAKKHAFLCAHTNKYFMENQKATLADGRTIAKCYAQLSLFTKEVDAKDVIIKTDDNGIAIA